MRKLIVVLISIGCCPLYAQNKSPVSISGTAGVTYEHYGVTVNPKTPAFYTPRRPWNQVRFSLAPTIKFGKYFSLPLNFSFATPPVNFAGPYAGIRNQSFLQFITNPSNNFGINPTYKWAELQLGTQYLNYSELSTGDVSVFGAGFSLKPKGYLLKFFTGVSQQGINYTTIPLPGTPGSYKRNNWMAQIGKEKEGKYKIALNMVKGKDAVSSVTTPPVTTLPQEGFNLTLVTDLYFKKGYYFKSEVARGIYTKDLGAAPIPPGGPKSLKPFINSNSSTITDYAATGGIGKKSQNFDIGITTKYLGAGYFTMGYPYMQPDRLDLMLNTRFNAWKTKAGNFKSNVVANIGQRINNMSSTTTRARQFIGNLNWFTQLNDKFSLNISYNNFGFNTTGSTLSGTSSLKNVSNDFSINPTFTWSNDKMNNVLSLNYSYSKYNETVSTPPLFIPTTTANNTHTVLLSYVPVYFKKKISPDFSIMYFINKVPGYKLNLLTVSAGAGGPVAKEKIQLKGQLQYNNNKVNSFTPSNNVIASCSIDWTATKKLNWNTFLSTNYFKYGNELSPPTGLIGARYLESTCRTGLQIKF